MSVVVFAAPYVPPPPPAPKWPGYRMTWRGADGSVWDLQGDQGIFILASGVVGLHLPSHERRTSVSPSKPGFRNRGTRTKERRVEWPIFLYADTSGAWRERDRAFWGSFSADVPGTWEVMSPNGRRLRLDCLFEGPEDYAFELDPSKTGWALYQIEMVAPDPYWYGDPISQTWKSSDPVEFFDPSGSPAFHISQASSLSSAKITNPGDVASWATYTITDQISAATITVDGGAFSVPSQEDGDETVIDTKAGVVTRNGTDISGDLGVWDPRPVPAGAGIPVTIAATGSGSVTAALTPLYRRGI